jgi:gamma-glutamyltranspeptidase/glutathione hydrolase
VGAAHARFGRLPLARIFDSAIHIADHGMPVTKHLAGKFEFRREDLSRLPDTRAVFMKPDGSAYKAGEVFRQPALASTLRAVATQGTDYIYKGAWAEKLVAAVQADGGVMTMDDLASYEVTWQEPLVGKLGAYQLYTNPPPNGGGVSVIEAQQLAIAAGLGDGPHWTASAAALKKALDISQVHALGYYPATVHAQLYPGLDFSSSSRTSPEFAEELWKRIQAGASPFRWKAPEGHHSDDVVVIDKDGNIAAITQTINCVDWGRTAINIDGISIGDPGSFQQAAIARIPPGSRLPAPTETGILFKDGVAVLGFASMGSGLHQRTFQALVNVMHFGMPVDEAINTADFLFPETDPKTGQLIFRVPAGRFAKSVLDGVGYQYREADPSDVRFGGEGLHFAFEKIAIAP